MENWAGYVDMVSKRDNNTTQDDVNEKLFEAIKLTVEKFDRKVEEQSTANKLIELSIDIMGSKFLHKEKVLADNIDESLAQMYNRIKHLENKIESIEFVQSNKKCCK